MRLGAMAQSFKEKSPLTHTHTYTHEYGYTCTYNDAMNETTRETWHYALCRNNIYSNQQIEQRESGILCL